MSWPGARLVAREHVVDRLPRGLQCGIAERAFGKHRRIARRLQQHIAVTQRNIELLGQMEHHVAARLRPPGFQKAEVARGDFGLGCEVELAQVPALPPLAQQVAHRSDQTIHGATIPPIRNPFQLPPM